MSKSGFRLSAMIAAFLLSIASSLAGVETSCQIFAPDGSISGGLALPQSPVIVSSPDPFDPDRIIRFDRRDPDQSRRFMPFPMGERKFLLNADTRQRGTSKSRVSWIAIYERKEKGDSYARLVFRKALDFNPGAPALNLSFEVPGIGKIECRGEATADPEKAGAGPKERD